MAGDLAGSGCPTQLLREFGAGPRQLRAEVFQSAGNFDRPPVVSDVSAYFAQNGGYCEGKKF